MSDQKNMVDTTLEQMVEYSFESVVKKEDGSISDNPTEATEEYFENLQDNINLLKKRYSEVKSSIESKDISQEKKEFNVKLLEAIKKGIVKEESEFNTLINKYSNDESYAKSFKIKVVETSTVVFLLCLETFHKDLFSNEDDAKKINLNQRIKEFLFASRSDDEHAFKMRLSYLQSANAEVVMLETMNMMTPEEQNIYQSSMNSKVDEMDRYDSLREDLIEKYSMRFPQFINN